MSYSEAMKYANEEEKGIEMEIYRREMEQQQTILTTNSGLIIIHLF